MRRSPISATPLATESSGSTKLASTSNISFKRSATPGMRLEPPTSRI